MAKRRPVNAGVLITQGDKSSSPSITPLASAASSSESIRIGDQKKARRKAAGTIGGDRADALAVRATRALKEKRIVVTQHEVVHGEGADGTRLLKLVSPRLDREDLVLDVSFLLTLPNLWEPMLTGIRRHLSTLASRGQPNWVKALRSGFFSFLSEHFPEAKLSDLDSAVLTAYVRWQDSPNAAYKNDRVLACGTARQRVQAGRSVLKALCSHAEWGVSAQRAWENYPKNTHKNALQSYVPRAILPRDLLDAIYSAALADVEAIRCRLDEGDRLIEEGTARLVKGDRDYSEISVALAAMTERYEGVFPIAREAKNLERELFNWVYRTSKGRPNAHGILRISSYCYGSSLDLVPIAILLSVEGAFNVETILNLTWKDISRRIFLGVPIVTIAGQKKRSLSGAYEKDLDPQVVDPWLNLLKRLTWRQRPSLRKHQSDHIFVFVPSTRGVVRARAFNVSNDSCWNNALLSFIKRHGLPRFNLAQLRPTLLDQVGLRHGSLAAQRAGQHQSLKTTDGHYLGPGTRDRERERLGETIQQMERWALSGGVVDVRRSARSPNADKGAATPGFTCADPYDSPQVGQIKQRLCRAYGMCPTCPLRLVRRDDYESVANWLALEQAIYLASETLDPQHWLQKWAPVAASVGSLIAQVAAPILERARKLNLHLPPVG